MTVCAFLRAKTGNMVSILQITFRKIDAADFADTPLFGKIQKEEKLNSTKKRKRGCRTTRLKNLVVWQLFFQKKGKNSAAAEFF